MRFRERRAVSEVVSTLLLIAIVVTLGVLVFTFASGGLGSLTGNFAGLISSQGTAVAEHDVVEQVSFDTAPSIDGTATGSITGGTTGTVTLTTANPDDIIVVFVADEDLTTAFVTVHSVAATGLTFTEKGTSFETTASIDADAEVWYATATSPETSLVITVTLSASADSASIVAVGVSGANTASPWDPNAALPADARANTGPATPTVSGVATTDEPDLILGFTGLFDASTHVPPTETPASGFNLITTQSNSGTTGKSEAAVEDQSLTSTESGASVGFGTADLATNAYLMIANAVVGNSGANVFVRNVGTTSSTLVSVYVVDQSTGTFVGQFETSAAVGVGAVVDLSQSLVAFTPAHAQAYSFKVTTFMGNGVLFYAKAS